MDKNLDISIQKRSVDRIIPMNSPASSSIPRLSEFQTHTYNTFLRDWTTDVTPRICASWDATYNYHRVILIQAVRTLFRLCCQWCTLRLHPFEESFRDLSQGGFVESE